MPRDPAVHRHEFQERVAREKARRALDVVYYRIGYTLAFPLPLARRPEGHALPVPIAGMEYPWLTWLSWELEERWRILHAAWRDSGDAEAGVILQRELGALAGWNRFTATDGRASLVTAHLAAGLTLGLEDTAGWDPDSLRRARAAAGALVERDVWPWFTDQWPERPLTAAHLHNVRVITLARAAQLARRIASPRADALEARARQVLAAWCRCRMGAGGHTEGTAYDGYLLDSVTEWMSELDDRARLSREGADAFRSVVDQWIHLTLPGRVDLHAPLGDVEPEMTFWANALARLAAWHRWPDAAWLLRRVPPARLRAAALLEVLAPGSFANVDSSPVPPAAEPARHPHALSLRAGWDADDPLVVVGAGSAAMGHLHADAGHVLLGWRARFWVTDPGYQQYRPGSERDYTIGAGAHNAPAIGGQTQSRRAADAQGPERLPDGWQRVRVDLTRCHAALPESADVRRDVWFHAEGDGRAVVVRDAFAGLRPGVETRATWQIDGGLACAFVGGWVRLSDGDAIVWIGTVPGELAASQLSRHPGSRGSLALAHDAPLLDGNGSRWWLFWLDPGGGWRPPTFALERGRLRIAGPGGPPMLAVPD